VGIPFIDESSRADGSRSGGVRGYWVGEAAQITSSHPTLGELELKLNKLAALVYVTDELLSDAAALTSYLNSDVPKELGFKMDDAIFRGDGAGKPIGLINANCAVEVAKESGQDADTVLWENVVKMFAQLWAGSASSAEWFINQNILPELYTMSQAVGTGGVAVYLPPGGASASPYGSLMGRPVNVIEQASTLGDAGDIVLADLDQYYWATKGGIESASSIHLKFDYDETALRWIYRCDGQPMWANSLTPYKDAGTSKPVSPIVTLAARA
jgi:HK97 family phage major capsid protein